MGIEENKEVVKQFVQRFGKGDSSVVDELTTDNFVFHALRYGGGDVTDKNYLKQTNDMGHKAFHDYTLTTYDMVAEGDKVMCISKRTGTNTGVFNGIPPTGNTVTIYRFWSFRIVNGKIADIWGMDDTLGQYQQLGVLPSIPEFIQAYKDSME